MTKALRPIPLSLSILTLAFAVFLTWALTESYRGFQGETFVRLERGAGTSGIARTLAGAGAIRAPWLFWIVRVMRPSASLQAGEYRFTKSATVGQVFNRIARGDVYFVEFTVPEGSNMFDIAHLIEAHGLMPADEFLRAASDPSVIRDVAPAARGLEGYLFPSTYRVSHGATAQDICKQMTGEFRKQWKKVAAGKEADVHRTVTLASMVEKETGVSGERSLVAGVFTNRLARGMHLDCDPTAIYAALLQNHYRGEIHRSDLASLHPYNTYQNAGLPPGPIANPGAESIAAALTPAETNYLYFVAKPSGGGHQFSTSLAEHDKAVKEYRRGTRNRSKAQRKTG